MGKPTEHRPGGFGVIDVDDLPCTPEKGKSPESLLEEVVHSCFYGDDTTESKPLQRIKESRG